MKTLQIFCLLALSLIFLGCETNDNDSDNTFMLSGTGLVSGAGDVVQPKSGDVRQLALNGKNMSIVITTSTQVQVMRTSGSGYSNGSAYDIRAGNNIEYFYFSDDVDRSIIPFVIRPIVIKSQ